MIEYRWRVGHAYSPLTLQAEEQDRAERVLWHSIIGLENAALILERLHEELGPGAVDAAAVRRAQAGVIR